MTLLPRSRCTCRSIWISWTSKRSAHAAAQTAEEGQSSSAGPSNYYRRSPDVARTDNGNGHGNGNGKGKGKAEEYRFPKKGRMGGEPDPFEIMNIDRSAPQSEVKRQYYKLALLLHPDSSHPSSSPEHFASLHKAYTLLSNPQSRNSYVQTGYGWSPTSTSSSSSNHEDRMRAEIRYRASRGAAQWSSGARYGDGRPMYGDSEGGRGAFGGFRGGDGKWEPYDTGEFDAKGGTGEERYMSNMQFLAMIAGISIALGWAQFQRFMVVKEQGSELLEKQHLDASHALAEARQEAALFGKERRERIRRRVRESEILREVEELERKQLSAE